VRLAWHVVAIWAQTRSKKKLPPLASLLVREGTGPSPKEKVAKMRSALDILSAQYGIPLRPLTPSDGGPRG
jgi:hypothetical protein